MATLTVRRDKGYADKMRKYHIVLDGAEIGRIAEGEVLRKEVSEGPHVLEARIDWCGSPAFEFNARAGEEVVLVRSALRGWRMSLGLLYVIFHRRGYLEIESGSEEPADRP